MKTTFNEILSILRIYKEKKITLRELFDFIIFVKLAAQWPGGLKF
jgi:hypothetical protein